MIRRFSVVLLVATALVAGAGLTKLPANTSGTAQVEYATLRWGGRENTHLIRPDGTTEILGAKFAGIRKPERVDDRSFYMNLAMNGLSREGFELVAMTPDDYIFKRISSPR